MTYNEWVFNSFKHKEDKQKQEPKKVVLKNAQKFIHR